MVRDDQGLQKEPLHMARFRAKNNTRSPGQSLGCSGGATRRQLHVNISRLLCLIALVYIALYIDSIHGKLISPKHTAANVFPDLTLQVVLFLKVPDSAPRSLSHTPTAHTSCSCILIISVFYYMLKEKQCRSGMEMELGYGGEVGSERE